MYESTLVGIPCKCRKFIYLGTTPTCQNYIHEETKGILNRGNAGYHSVQNRLSSVCYQRVLENRVLSEIPGPERKWQENGRNWIMRDATICIGIW